MIPIDAKIWDEMDVRHEGLNIDELLSTLKDLGAHTRLVAIDASRRNPYERRFRSYSHGLAPAQASEGAVILTSAEPNMVANDSNEPGTPFTTALVQQISSSNRPLTQVFEQARVAPTIAPQDAQAATSSPTSAGPLTN